MLNRARLLRTVTSLKSNVSATRIFVGLPDTLFLDLEHYLRSVSHIICTRGFCCALLCLDFITNLTASYKIHCRYLWKLFHRSWGNRMAVNIFISPSSLRRYGIVEGSLEVCKIVIIHEDVIQWKHFPRYWSFVRGIHRSPVDSPHKGQWRGVLMFSLIGTWINGWINNREAGYLRRHRAHYDVIVM